MPGTRLPSDEEMRAARDAGDLVCWCPWSPSSPYVPTCAKCKKRRLTCEELLALAELLAVPANDAFAIKRALLARSASSPTVRTGET